MDELEALDRMRAGLPDPDPVLKARLWDRLQQEADTGRFVDPCSKVGRVPRAVRRLLVGLVLLGAVAFSPAGPAVADRVSDLLGGGNSQSRREINEIDRRIKDLSPSDLPPGLSPQQRHEAGAARIQAILDDVARRPGGIEQAPPYPPGVIMRIKPNPLAGLDMEEYDAFCLRVAERMPKNRSCAMNRMVQAGELPPGDYTRARIDEIFGLGEK